MGGEAATSLDVDTRGVVGDRCWSVRTPVNKIGSGKNTRRFEAVHGLLRLRAAHVHEQVVITFPGGRQLAVDDPAVTDAISAELGRPVTVARETDVSHFDDGPVSLLGLGSVAALSAEVGADVDHRRFRPNLVLEGVAPLAEDSWVGRQVRIGGVRLEVTMRSPRCVMVDMQ